MRARDYYTFPPDWKIGDYPGFDTVELKNKIQAEIRLEAEGLTDEEICEYNRLGNAREELRRKARERQQAALVGTDN